MVLDFSGYEPKWVHDNCQVLKGKVGVYIYISTDSVYEVSIDKPTKRPSLETDAVRPKDENEVGLLKKKDPYGHYKLSCEEALVHYQQHKQGFPWVSLRLADVIGPRDTTNRWAGRWGWRGCKNGGRFKFKWEAVSTSYWGSNSIKNLL